MQTPRPDHFTYPHGRPAESRLWTRALFIGGLVGVVALGMALSLA